MGKYVLEEAKELSVFPVDSVIQATCTEINEKIVPGKDGKEGWAKLEFTFVVDGVPSALQDSCGSLVGTKIWGSVPARFTTHPDNKLRQWAVGLLGMELSEGFELDTDVLINRRARVVTGQYVKSNGSARHQVEGVLPLVPAATPAPVQQPAVQAQRPGDVASEAVAGYAQAAQPVLAAGWDDAPPF